MKEHVAVTITQWIRAAGAVFPLEVGKEAEKTIYWEEQPEMAWELKISEDSRWHERDWKLLTDKWGGNIFKTTFSWKSVQAESRKLSFIIMVSLAFPHPLSKSGHLNIWTVALKKLVAS